MVTRRWSADGGLLWASSFGWCAVGLAGAVGAVSPGGFDLAGGEEFQLQVESVDEVVVA